MLIKINKYKTNKKNLKLTSRYIGNFIIPNNSGKEVDNKSFRYDNLEP